MENFSFLLLNSCLSILCFWYILLILTHAKMSPIKLIISPKILIKIVITGFLSANCDNELRRFSILIVLLTIVINIFHNLFVI